MHKQRKCNCVWRLHQDGVTFDVFTTLTSRANATASDTKEDHCSVNVAKVHKQRRFICEHNIDTRKETKLNWKSFLDIPSIMIRCFLQAIIFFFRLELINSQNHDKNVCCLKQWRQCGKISKDKCCRNNFLCICISHQEHFTKTDHICSGHLYLSKHFVSK